MTHRFFPSRTAGRRCAVDFGCRAGTLAAAARLPGAARRRLFIVARIEVVVVADRGSVLTPFPSQLFPARVDLLGLPWYFGSRILNETSSGVARHTEEKVL